MDAGGIRIKKGARKPARSGKLAEKYADSLS
jgi:hypothetical protein